MARNRDIRWLIAWVVVLAAVAVDYGVWRLLRQQLGGQAARVWLIFVILCYASYAVFVTVALFLPLITVPQVVLIGAVLNQF